MHSFSQITAVCIEKSIKNLYFQIAHRVIVDIMLMYFTEVIIVKPKH